MKIFRRKGVPSTPSVSPTQDRVHDQVWVDESNTQSVLDTIFSCLKPSRPPSDHPSNLKVPSSSSLSTSPSNTLPDEDVIYLGITSRKPKGKKSRKRNRLGRKRAKSGNKRGFSSASLDSESKQAHNVHSKILHNLNTKSMEVDDSGKIQSCSSKSKAEELRVSAGSTGTRPHNLEYTQSATTSKISSSTNDTEKKREMKSSFNMIPRLIQRNHRKSYDTDTSSPSEISQKKVPRKKIKHRIIRVKAANVTSSNINQKNAVSSLLTRQTAEEERDPSDTTNISSSFGMERLLLGNSNFCGNERVNQANSPPFNEADSDLIRVFSPTISTSSSSNGWESVLREMADHSAQKMGDIDQADNSVKLTEPCSEIDRPWLAAMGGIGAFNSGSKSLRRVETEEKPFVDMSHEERQEARRKYCLLIQQQRENVSRLQKRQQKVRGNVEELTNAISRVKRSLVRCKDITSTYAVEFKIISLDQKRSTAKEGVQVLEKEINQRMLKVKELSSNIAQLKLLDEEHDATRDAFNKMYRGFQFRGRPLGAHNSRIRSRTENMQRYLPYSYTQQESDSDEEKQTGRGTNVQSILDNARKHLERHSYGGCTSKLSRSGAHFTPKVKRKEDSAFENYSDKYSLK